MHSSTSSSDASSSRWALPLAGGLLIALLGFALLETAVRLLGNEPGVRDGPALWSLMRTRADRPDTIVLVGSSRMQLDIDVPHLAELTGRPVVQLAIDGQSFQPVLADLAADDDFRGTVLVEAIDQNLSQQGDFRRAQSWVDHWHQRGRSWSASSDSWLALQLQRVSAWYASEPPWQEMLHRIAGGQAATGYLLTLPDRSRRADYGPPQQQAQMYVGRVLRSYVQPVDMRDITTLDAFEARMNALLDHEPARQVPDVAAEAASVQTQAAAIRARDGQVIFLRLPTRGLIRRIEEVRYPRGSHWDAFVAAAAVDALHFADDPHLAAYLPPDGSHLDQRDVRRFTDDLHAALAARHLL